MNFCFAKQLMIVVITGEGDISSHSVAVNTQFAHSCQGFFVQSWNRLTISSNVYASKGCPVVRHLCKQHSSTSRLPVASCDEMTLPVTHTGTSMRSKAEMYCVSLRLHLSQLSVLLHFLSLSQSQWFCTIAEAGLYNLYVFCIKGGGGAIPCPAFSPWNMRQVW